jgi:hypothetical protein
MRRVVVLAGVLAGCSAPSVARVDIFTFGGVAPSFAMVRNGQHWEKPTATATGYNFEAHDDYLFVEVCTDTGGFFDAEARAATVADGNATVVCGGNLATYPVPPNQVIGSMVQPGVVSVPGWSLDGGAPNWTFTLPVPTGPFDLVASTSTTVAVLRDLAPPPNSAMVTLEPIDVAKTGQPLVALTPQAGSALASETPFNMYFYSTAAGAGFNTGSTSALQVAPATLLAAGDQQSLQAWFNGPNSTRGGVSVVNGVTSPVTELAIPPAISPTFVADDGGDAADLPALPDSYDTLSLLSDDISGAHTQGMIATRAWVEATGATRMAFDTSAPGYDPAWVVPIVTSAGQHGAQLDVRYHDPSTGVDYSTSAWAAGALATSATEWHRHALPRR